MGIFDTVMADDSQGSDAWRIRRPAVDRLPTVLLVVYRLMDNHKKTRGTVRISSGRQYGNSLRDYIRRDDRSTATCRNRAADSVTVRHFGLRPRIYRR